MDKFKKYREIICEKRNLSYDFSKSNMWHDSNLLPDFNKIVSRISIALKNGENILIWGDQDADGITASAILYLALKKFSSKIDVYIPDRKKEGVGFNLDKLKVIINKYKPNLIITVDCCSRDFVAAEYIKEKNIDLIITDHHETNKNLPESIGVLNCKKQKNIYPFRELAGCGVSLKIALHFSNNNDYLWILAMFGTIADRVPLIDENRYIVKKGLKLFKQKVYEPIEKIYLHNSVKPETIKEIKRSLISTMSSDIIKDNISLSFKALINEASNDEIKLLVEKSRTWFERKNLEMKLIENQVEFIGDFVFLYLPNVESEFLGTLCSYINIKYGKPAIIIGYKFGEYQIVNLRGNLNEVLDVLNKNASLFENYGGHKKAAGAKIHNNNINKFKKNISKYKYENYKTRKLRIDLVLMNSEITDELLEFLSEFAPFGQNNPEISIEIPDRYCSMKIENINLFLLNEEAVLREAEIFNDIWE